MLTPSQNRDFVDTVAAKRADFQERNNEESPTKLFINRTLYFEVIMEPAFSRELNEKKTLFGMEIYQVIPIFGSPNDKVIEVA